MQARLLASLGLIVAASLASTDVAAGARRRATTTTSSSKAASPPRGATKAHASKPSVPSREVAATKTSRGPGPGGASRRGAKRGAKRVATSTPREVRADVDAGEAPVVRRPRAGVLTPIARTLRCPDDMVAVAGRVCVDRYEMHLVDARSGATWSPFYPPNTARARTIADFYEALRTKESAPWLGALLVVPEVPRSAGALRAASAPGVVPQGHLTAEDAEGACRGAGKRLCSESEWLTACRGDRATDFPYGTTYEQGACNVYRESHPSWLLHGNAARYHDDPRNNVVATDAGPLLRATGATPRCASRWGDDAIYDLVGNLDEWVADDGGVFAGGFYARPTKSGCFARVSNHPRTYADYSTGARCCADPLLDG